MQDDKFVEDLMSLVKDDETEETEEKDKKDDKSREKKS